ncbi:sulfotransferase domain-containing protein [Nitrospira sp. M1]
MTRPKLKFDFILLGARKCATTSLYAALRTHPELCLPYDKEIDLFAEEEAYTLGETHWRSYYQNDWDPAKTLKIGNCHTCYLYHPQVPDRLKQHNDSLKLIVTIREPIARAKSDYIYHKRLGLERRTFKEAITQQLEGHNLSNPSFTDRYLFSGLYSDHISQYLQTFGKEQVQIIFFEDLARQPNEWLQKVFQFLDIDTSFIPPSESMSKNKASLPIIPSLSRALIQFRLLPNRRTKSLIRQLFGNTLLVNMKQSLDKFEKSLLRPSSHDLIGQEMDKILQEYYHEEIIKIKELMSGRLPEQWEACLTSYQCQNI